LTQEGSTGEPSPDPHAPAFADLYAGFMSAEKIRARFVQGVAGDVSAWTEKLYTGDAGEAQLAARWLGQHGGRDALEPLKDALTHSDARVRAAALLALGDLGDRRALPALCDRLASDGASMARQAAAQSLGRIGDRSVESALEASAEADAKSKVRRAAGDALAQIRARPPWLRHAGQGGAKPPS
jgi:HEAT repeat protein